MKKIIIIAIILLFVCNTNAQAKIDSTKIYFNLGKFDKALKFAIFHNEHQQLFEKGIILFNNNDFENARKFISTAYNLTENTLVETEKISYLNVIGICYEQINDFKNATESYKKAIKLNIANSDEYFNTLSQFSTLQCETEEFQIAKKQSELYLSEAEKHRGKDSSQYLLALNNICLFYISNGVYDVADKYCFEFIEVNNIIFGNQSVESLKASSVHLNILISQGKTIDAEKKAILLLEKYNQYYEENYNDIALAYNQLATIQQDLLKFDLALNNFTKALNYIKEKIGEQSKYYALVASNLGVLFIELEKYDEAEFYLKKSLEIKNIIDSNIDNSTLYANLATVYQKTNRCNDAVVYNLKSIENLNNQFGDSYRTKILNIALTYNCLKNTQKEYQYLLTFADILKNKVVEITKFMTNSELEQYLQKFIHQKIYSLSFLKRNPTYFNLINISCFEDELLFKNLLIHNQQRISISINKSKNQELKTKYDEFVTNKKQISLFNEFPKEQRAIFYDDLNLKIENLEKELVQQSVEFSSFKNGLSIKFKKLQDKLKPNELVVDFIDFLYYDYQKKPDSIVYAAFIIKKNTKFPKFISLFEEEQLNFLLNKNKNQPDSNRIDKQYTDKTITKLFLKPFEKELEGISTIYLSPSGLGHQIDFAALPLSGNQTLGEKYKLHILSSPAESIDYKVSKIDKKSNIELLLYGGIDYNKSISKTEINNVNIEENNDITELKTRSGISKFGYLNGTNTEVKKIQSKGAENGFVSTILNEDNATEESIKALDGRTNPFVLHLATHGFFFPDPEQEIPKDVLLETGKAKIYKASDNPMMRSGLLFAGVNNFWSKTNLTSTTDDGILTANEISNLDLSACQLVVLSACETALGEVKGSEGVFGLQRAFKMAGVKNIIMSLWKVPDIQTAELFEIFYSECFVGKTIHEAFQIAQTKMKAKYSPYYWAGFVLLE